VAAITGGTLVIFADRLPAENRAAAWAQAYEAYSLLWKEQGPAIDQFPVHFRGEVLAGMAQSAQRTGRADEAAQFVDKLLAMPGTPYEKLAKEWKANPASASTSNLTCKTCHGPGRLSARLADLNK
jgi:putative intracellular protease/amidase